MIAVDWGSSSLRAYRLDAAGGILEQRRSDQGVLLCDGEFAEVLVKLIEGWDDPVILLSGMTLARLASVSTCTAAGCCASATPSMNRAAVPSLTS